MCASLSVFEGEGGRGASKRSIEYHIFVQTFYRIPEFWRSEICALGANDRTRVPENKRGLGLRRETAGLELWGGEERCGQARCLARAVGVVEQRDAGGLGANDDVSLPSSWCIW